MSPIRTAIFSCLVLALGACGGGELSVESPDGDVGTVRLFFAADRAAEHRLPFNVAGGIPPYHASIEGCPDWVNLFPRQGIVAGTAPPRDFGKIFYCSFHVTDATDPDPQTRSRVLRLDVGSPGGVSTVAPLRLSVPADRSFIVDTFYSVTLPAAVGGLTPHRYSFTCAGGSLPPGMGFAGQTRVLAGTPNAAFRDSCVYTVTDSSNLAVQVSQPIELAVLATPPPPLTLPALPDQDLVVGDYRSITLPAAAGGLRPHEYSFTCAGGSLPPGMGFAPETRVLAGTPTAAFRDSCVYTVTDSSNPAAQVSQPVQVTVLATPLPAHTVPPVADLDLVVGVYRAITLPAAVDVLKSYRYSFTCAGGRLPPGMGFAHHTRVLAGTPSAAFRDSCVYTVTDSSNPAVQVSQPVQVTVLATPPPSHTVPPVADQDLVVGVYRAITLPAAVDVLKPYRYSFTCAGGSLPPGMGFAPETRVLAGTPTAAFRDSCVYTATDSSNPAVQVSQPVQVTVLATPPPPLTLPTLPDQDLVVGDYSSITLPAAAGGLRPHEYSFTCAGGRLPPGMGFAHHTRVLAGTPNAAFRDSCVYTVTDSSNPTEQVSQPVQVTVLATPPPSHTVPPVADQDLVVGVYRAITLPAAVDALKPYRYSFTCAGGSLPPGMGFAPETRVLAGTPTAAFRDSCVYTATDISNPAVQVSQPVQVTVLATPPPPLTLPTLPDQDLVVGDYSSITLPAAAGGLRPHEYSFTCAGGRLPPGMGFAHHTRVLAGTPNCGVPRFVRLHGDG